MYHGRLHCANHLSASSSSLKRCSNTIGDIRSTFPLFPLLLFDRTGTKSEYGKDMVFVMSTYDPTAACYVYTVSVSSNNSKQPI